MTESLLPLLIAGIPVEIDLAGLTAAQRAVLHTHYAAFTASWPVDGLRVRVCSEPGLPYIDPAGHKEWQIRTVQEQDRIIFESFFERGWIDRRAGVAELTMRPNGNPENFLRVLYAWECLARRSLLLHASGVIRNGKGYVFFGHSGAGKTTLARLSTDATVLSDDLVILGWQDGRVTVFGVPFRGEMVEAPRTNAAAPLYGLLSPVKDSRHALIPLAPATAIAQLAAVVPFVNSQPESMRQVLDICAAIQAQTSAQALHFRRDAGFWTELAALEQPHE